MTTHRTPEPYSIVEVRGVPWLLPTTRADVHILAGRDVVAVEEES